MNGRGFSCWEGKFPLSLVLCAGLMIKLTQDRWTEERKNTNLIGTYRGLRDTGPKERTNEGSFYAF